MWIINLGLNMVNINKWAQFFPSALTQKGTGIVSKLGNPQNT